MAVFATKIGATSRITNVKAGCLIKGFALEVPNCIQFYQNHKNDSEAVCLTIAWSSGRIQHFPIVSHVESQTDVCRNTTFSSSVIGSPLYSSFSSYE